MLPQSFEMFFEREVKPTLTEDEKVILRNINKEITTIRRTAYGDLDVFNEYDDHSILYIHVYNHLFQFIKNGEEYYIKDLLGE